MESDLHTQTFCHVYTKQKTNTYIGRMSSTTPGTKNAVCKSNGYDFMLHPWECIVWPEDRQWYSVPDKPHLEWGLVLGAVFKDSDEISPNMGDNQLSTTAWTVPRKRVGKYWLTSEEQKTWKPERLCQLRIWLLSSARVLLSGSWVQALRWAPHWTWSLLKQKQK